ncbi:MAG: ABC transporter ATP-binding protein [Bacteroidota bacterium]
MSDPILHARGLTKRFSGTTAVDALDLAIHPGEVYALLGPNGAGKTTTINLFLGFLAPDGGEALVDGLDVQAEPLETKRRLAYLPEQVALYPSLSGAENLKYFAALAGHDLTEADLAGFLDRAGLQREAHARHAGTYSKGMRQKVGIALALAKGAKALLLDEPTSGLDPSASVEFSGLVRRLAEAGAAVLMATHDLFRVKDTASRVGVLVGGRLREEVSHDALPTTDLEALYLGHVREAEAPVLS